MKDYPIPTRLNLLIVLLCTIAFFGLFFAAGQTTVTGWKLLFGFLFALVLIPVYALMHEAAHGTLHASERWNRRLGRWLCGMFMISFTFYRHCHLKHHKKNRTDDEMWDLYYEHQNRFLRYGNLYLMMLGFGYWVTWTSVPLFVISPKMLIHSFLRRHREINGFLAGFTDPAKLRTARIESMLVIFFQLLLLWMTGWDWQTWITFYLVHGLIWSSQNYVNHAFSPRDIINGAHNLRMPRWLNLIYLNFNIHLAHHQHPQIPWLYLPAFLRKGRERISFFRNYLRLWKGPKLTRSNSPDVSDDFPLPG